MNNLMKISLVVLLLSSLSFTSLLAQNDVMYIMKDGVVVGKYNVNTEIDSIVFYEPIIANTFTDSRDGNTYQTVAIDNQVWMAENLKYLPSVNQVSDGSITDLKYYVYDYNGTDVIAAKATSNYQTYGVLYNWTASQNACPTGWHLPSDDEWTELTDYLIANGYNHDTTTTGNKIAKAMASTRLWDSSTNVGAIGNDLSQNNASGFSALPGGSRSGEGSFKGSGNYGIWWSATENNSDLAWYRGLKFNYKSVNRFDSYKDFGGSVRCVKD